MTTEAETKDNLWTHGTGAAKRPHEWRYLGRIKQEYMCTICQLRVSKRELKEGTDA